MKHLFKYLIFLLVLMTTSAYAQKIVNVKGTVVEKSNNLGLPGVNILSGTPLKSVGSTGGDGSFSINVPENASLVFTYIGFNNQTIKLNGKNVLRVLMQESNNDLKTVVVVGYAPKTKEVATGALTTISGKALQDVPVANVMELLQGKVAGLNIQNNTGSPGARGSIFVRGLSSIEVQGSGNDAFLTPTSPLFVIDGVPLDANTNYEYGFSQGGPGISPLSLIPPEDIEEVTVLKDAQATSLYGSQGAYGVILITTKRGKSKTPIIQYVTSFFVNTPPKLKQVIGGKGERDLRLWQIMNYDTTVYSARQRIDNNPLLSDSLNAFYNNSTDWQNVFYRTTLNQNHNVNASGGDERFNYKVNLGYYDERGIVENTGLKRYSLGMNVLYQPNEKFRLFANVSSALGMSQKGSGNGILQSGVASGSSASSLLPAPSLFSSSGAATGVLIVDNNNKSGNIKTNLEARYQVLKPVSVTSVINYDYNTGTEDTFKPSILNNNSSNVYSYNDRRSTLYNRNMISYAQTFNAVHNVNAYVFNEMYIRNYQAQAVSQVRTPNDQYQGPLGFNAATSRGGVLSSYADSRSAALATQLSYNYDRKYVLDLSYRWDGVSSSGPDVPWSKNPSIGLKWNFNRESWFKNAKWLDYGSLRTTWGKNIVPNGTVFDAFGSYNFSGVYNGSQSIGVGFGNLPNTTLTPTVTTQYNAGLDVGLFEGKYQFTFDTYYKMVDNQIREKTLADHNGFGAVKTNEVSLVNYGYELSLTVRPLAKTSKVNWTVSANGAINKDVLTSLPDRVRQILLDGGATGQAILYRLGVNSLSNVLYNTKGVYASTDAVAVDPATGKRYQTTNGGSTVFFQGGDPYWTDLNGDYKLDGKDLVIAGNSQPMITGGVSSFFSYKNYSVNVNMSYTLRRDILNVPLAERFQNFSNPGGANSLVPIEELQYWKSAGDVALYPNPYDYLRYSAYSPFRYNQTLFQEDGSYLKLNTLTLAYTFDKKFAERLGITSMRVYCTGNNLYTFTNYSGPDPENVSDLGRDNSSGYPSRRSYSLGLNIQF
ncbi:SusC/RagA family TonB-linked outer membrane protein [Pedobacter frigoris]|uniref:SusC/RagA family TonB-linked outer membrane protein n=2 Tax=Pedobacter frigoris TaxID=2571272 RepID=A0A4U1CE76_9SPHI|nr:SusC/RagA family TonB-linked outer membrane protein [Pedobacter frigoris]